MGRQKPARDDQFVGTRRFSSSSQFCTITMVEAGVSFVSAFLIIRNR